MLIGFSSFRAPSVAYRILVTLYSYSVVILVAFFVSTGLLYVRFFREKSSWTRTAGFQPWGGPTAAIFFTLVCIFLIIAPFVPPKAGSPFVNQEPGKTTVAWYIVPTVGIGAIVIGLIYYLGLIYVIPPLFKKNKVLVADREAIIVREHGEYVQYMEIVDAAWLARSDNDSDFELDKRVTRVRLES